MADMEQYPQEWREYKPIQPRGTDWRGIFRKLWAPIAAVGAFLAKFGAALLKFKFLFSMFVSAAVYVWLGGWWFGIGLVVLLFVHEMGHVLEAKRQGLPVSAPLFIPFMGAFVAMKEMPKNAYVEAKVGLAGPVLGTAGALVVLIWAEQVRMAAPVLFGCQARHDPKRRLEEQFCNFIVLMQARRRRRDAVACQQLRGPARVFGRDDCNLAQDAQRPHRNVFEVADGCGDHEQRAAHVKGRVLYH